MSKQKSLTGLLTAAIICMAVIFSPITAGADSLAEGLSLSITPDVETASLGETITYSYLITSTCNTTVTGLVLTDDRLGTIALASDILGPGENITAAAQYTVAEADFPGPLTGSASVTGVSGSGDTMTDNATSSVTLNALNASIKVSISADRRAASENETIKYSYTIINTGQGTLNNITLTDSRLGAITLAADNLSPEGKLTVSAQYTVQASDYPGPLVTRATVSAVDAAGQTISAVSGRVSIKLATETLSRLTKAQVLKLKGVPGKGIEHAWGLMKFFNSNSQAHAHAVQKGNGKNKNKDK